MGKTNKAKYKTTTANYFLRIIASVLKPESKVRMTIRKTIQITNNACNLAFMPLFPLQDKNPVHEIQGMILRHILVQSLR